MRFHLADDRGYYCAGGTAARKRVGTGNYSAGGTTFKATFGEPGRTYLLSAVHPSGSNGSMDSNPWNGSMHFDDVMIEECMKIGMKPICDHPSYCRADKWSLYIGQTSQLDTESYRLTQTPKNFCRLNDKFTNMCFYSGRANKRYGKFSPLAMLEGREGNPL